MKIKVCKENKKCIENLLKEVNCDAVLFTIVNFDEVCEICLNAEWKMYQSGLIESQKQGAEIRVVSGRSVAKSYKHKRMCTGLCLYRGKKEWFLVAAYCTMLFPNESGYVNIVLTDKQKQIIVDKFLRSFDNI